MSDRGTKRKARSIVPMKGASARRAAGAAPGWMQQLLKLPFIGVAICGTSDRGWTRLNERFCALVGYERTQLERMGWSDICHPGDREILAAGFRRLAQRREPDVRVLVRLIHKDRRAIPVEAYLSFAPRNARAAGEQVVALVADAGSARAAAEDLPAQMIFRDGRAPMVVLDAESWNIVDANPAAQSFYGWSLETVKRLGLHVWDVSNSERAVVMKRLREAASGAVARVEDVHRTASGELRDVEIYCGPVRLHGRPCVYGIVHDRTEARQQEAARRDAEEKLQAVVEQSIAGFYIIEDGRFSFINPRLAQIFGYSSAELIGAPVQIVVAPEDRDRSAENIRRRIAGEVSSLQFDFQGLRKDGTVIDIGAHGSVAVIRGKRVIVGVLQDITERRRSQRQSDEYLRKLEKAMTGAVGALSRMVDLRDPYTAGHERRVAGIAGEIAKALGLPGEQVRAIQIAGQVHDIGKISIPSEILSKPTRLAIAEFDIVKMHAENGYEILKVVEFPWRVADMAHQHHERMDGSGYPHKLKGDQIIPEARILMVADVIEAMASHRPYRASIGIEPALAEIERGAGLIYDAQVAAATLRLFRIEGYQIQP